MVLQGIESRLFALNGELRHLFGWLPDRPDHRDIRYVPRGLKRPVRIDLRRKCSRVENQGHLGACAANAATSAVEFLYRTEERESPEFSRLFCYYASRIWIDHGKPTEDVGAPIRSVLKALSNFGCCFETQWPYDPSRYATAPSAVATQEAAKHFIHWYYRIEDLTTLRLCLAEGFPVIGGFSLPATIDSTACRRTGLIRYPGPREKFVGGHAALFCGYDDSTRLLTFKNSWGPEWGDKGFGYLPYSFVTEGLASDFWTLRSIAR